MRLLIHTDALVEALAERRRDFFASLREKEVPVWVLTCALPDGYRQLSERLGAKAARDALGEVLSQVSLLPLPGKDLRNLLSQDQAGFLDSLAAQGARLFGLDAVVTLRPEGFAALEIPAWTLEETLEQLRQPPPPVQQVPLLNIPASCHEWLDDVEQAMSRVIGSGQFILGKTVAELESLSARYCGTRFALGVSSGTDALLLSLMACGIGPEDEVITSAFTFFATAGVIARLGAKPVFVDIDPETFNLDPRRVEEALTPRTRAILPVHLYGQCADMDPILETARRRKLRVIEDAAQAIGAEYQGRRAGSLGDAGCFSFFPTKNLGAFGDGGFISTQSEDFYESLKILRVHGMHPKYIHRQVGGNFRLDALQAAVVSAKWPYLDGWTRRRREHAARYTRRFQAEGLADRLGLPREKFPGHVYNQYVVRVPEGKRDALREFLSERGVMTEIYYPIPLHLQECFRSLGYREGDFPHAEQAAREVLALPISFEMTPEQQDHVVACIRDFFS